ncbi:MAG TPA: sugar phosphate isomerase/epimerase family protein [Candidatus Dormibacteraeota bacterium]|jgi:sugar phosphate isomerase/epimerase|nr:sugar phosphate isomerase/epimerase family protein [Candidatus Dormibacteraeota bacterium]
MKFSLLTHLIAHSWDLPKLIETAQGLGFAGLEFRVEEAGGHGVELERTQAERRQIRERVEDAYLEIVALGTGARLDSPDEARRREAMDHVKRYVDLATDLGCTRIRVFGNDIPEGVCRQDCTAYVGEGLRSIAEYSDPGGVDILLEMHGQFNYWGFALEAVMAADHPRVGILYNCDLKDMVGGSVSATYGRVAKWVRHIHMHDLASGYPYLELFQLLQRSGYDGYLSPELSTKSPTPDQYLALYATLSKAWAACASHTSPSSYV